MKNIIKQLSTVIKGLDYQVYFDESDGKQQYPFIVIKIPSSVNFEDTREDYFVTVDIWTKDIMQAITIADDVENALNRYHYLDEYIQFIAYKTNRLNNLKDDDTTIKRNQLRFTIQAHKRG